MTVLMLEILLPVRTHSILQPAELLLNISPHLRLSVTVHIFDPDYDHLILMTLHKVTDLHMCYGIKLF